MMRYRTPVSIKELHGHIDKPCGLVTCVEPEPVPAILLDFIGRSPARGIAFVRIADGRVIYWPLRELYLGEVVVPSPDPLTPRARILHALLRHFLADYLHIVEPETAAHLRLESAVFCEPDVPDWTNLDRAAAGAIARVRTRKGKKVTVFVQVEPEAPSRFNRLVRQVFDLELRHCQPVLASAIHLRGGKSGVNLESVPMHNISSMVIQRLHFTSFGLSGARAEYYLERPEPIAWALAAAMQPTRWDRAELRRACLGRIDSSSLPPEQKRLLSSFVEPGRR
jgi:hypothetical protein